MKFVFKRSVLIVFIVYALLIVCCEGLFLKAPELPPSGMIRGTISSIPQFKEYGQQAELLLQDPLPNTKARIIITQPLPDLAVGDELYFKGKLSAPTTYRNPGTFDYAGYLLRRGILATIYLKNGDGVQIKKAPPDFLDQWRANYYQSSRNILDSLTIDAASRGVMMALIWGDDSGLDQATKDLFRSQGIYHLLVISGLHFTALLVVVFFLVHLLLRVYPKIYLNLPGKIIPSIVAIGVLTFYFLLCFEGASITRAYLFALGLCLAYLWRRNLDTLNLVFLVALLMLLVHPLALFDLSFQFSFIAVLALIALYPKLDTHIPTLDPTRGPIHKLIFYIRKMLLITLAIFIGLTPLTAYHFHLIQLAGFFNNLWAVPYLEFLVTPLLLAGFFIAPYSSLLAQPFFSLAAYLLSGSFQILHFLQNILPTENPIYPPHIWELIVYFGLLILWIMPLARKLKYSALAIAITLLLNVNLWTLYDTTTHTDLRINQLDVGQGDAMLLELPGNKKVFIDVGGSRFTDIAKKAIIPHLDYRRITTIDALVITHDDMDHMGAGVALLDAVRVKALYWNGQAQPSIQMQALLDRAANIPIHVLQAGQSVPMGDCRALVLSPRAGEIGTLKDNDASVVLKWDCPGATALTTGDISQATEAKLVARYGSKLRSDFLKLAHHGSKYSNNLDFLKAVHPQLVSISSKKNNRFHHPHPEVLRRLESQKISSKRTDQEGLIRVSIEKNKVRLMD